MTDRLLTEAGDVLVTESGYGMQGDAWVALSFYKRRLLNDVQITKSLSNIYWGLESPHEVTLEFNNADGFFSDLMSAGEEFRGRGVKLRRYEPLDGTPISFELYGVITNFNVLPDVASFTVAVKDPDPLQTLLPKKTFETGDFFTDDPPPPATPTHMHPAGDLGKAFSLCFGYCKKVPLRYVSANFPSDYYDYIIGPGPIESNNSNKATTVNIYRDKVLVSNAEYYVHGGEDTIQYTDSSFGMASGAASPYRNAVTGESYAFVRFKLEQMNFNGSMHEVTMDLRGLKLGGATAERNFARILQYVLSNSVWGLGLTINSASFDTAASAVLSVSPQVLMSGVYCDYAIPEQRRAQDIINDLLYPWGRLDRNEDGEWTIGVDTYRQTVSATFGHRDGKYNNIISIDEYSKTPTAEAIKEFTANYRLDLWEGEYKHKNKRSIFSFGEDQTVDLPCVRVHSTADVITSRVKSTALIGDEKLSIKVGMEGRNLRVGDAVRVIIPDINIDGIFQVRRLARQLSQFSLGLVSYGQAIYDYVAGTMPPDENGDDETDLSNTPPAAPTDFSIISWDRSVGNDGGTAISVILRATPPTTNFAKLIFGWKKTTDTTYSYRDGEAPSAGICKGRIDGLVSGVAYDFMAVAVNAFGVRSVGNPVLSNQNAGGDLGAPSAPTGLTATGILRGIRLECTPGTEAGLAEYLVYRNTTNNSGTATKIFTSPAAKLRVVGDKLKFTDNTITSYSQKYYYWLKAVDREGNTSGFSSVSNPLGTQALQVDADDLGDGIIAPAYAYTEASLPCNPNTETTIQSAAIATTSGKVRVHFDLGLKGQVGVSVSYGTLELRRGGSTIRTFEWDISEAEGYRRKNIAHTVTDSPGVGGPYTYSVVVIVPLGQRAVYASNRSVELEMKK